MIAFLQQNRQGIDAYHEGTVSGSDRLSWFCTSLSFLYKRRIEDIITDYENEDRDDEIEPANLVLNVKLSRFGSAHADNESILLYSDIQNPRMESSKKTAKMFEVGLQRYSKKRKNVAQ
jgi:hypothetical protein